MGADAEFWAGFRGELETVRARADGAASSAAERAWRAAARALLVLAGESDGPPALEGLPAEPTGEAALPSVLAADLLGWSAFMAFDARAHRAAAERARRAAGEASGVASLYVEVAALRQAVLEGRGAADQAADLERRALELAHAPVVLEAAALRALGELEADVEAAVRTARRAVRMARTEGLPLPELLANLVLARARRLSDRPHLSVRILRGFGSRGGPAEDGPPPARLLEDLLA